MGALVVYYSRTGTTARVARTVADDLESPTVDRIRPVTRRRYADWLVRSFVPGSRVPIRPVETDLTRYDAVFLGTPKWTLSCPPVTEYVERADVADVRMGLFVTYGGFDEARYTRRLADTLRDRGADVAATLRVQRNRTDTAACADGVAEFCAAVGDG